MPSKCCRSCPRCADCPVLVAAAGRARRHEGAALANLVDEVFSGFQVRALPESVTRTLEALDDARRGAPVAGAA